jgi:hypothetical protein
MGQPIIFVDEYHLTNNLRDSGILVSSYMTQLLLKYLPAHKKYKVFEYQQYSTVPYSKENFHFIQFSKAYTILLYSHRPKNLLLHSYFATDKE